MKGCVLISSSIISSLLGRDFYFCAPILWVIGALSLGVKQLGHEADHSPPSSAKVEECGTVPPLFQYAFMVWCSVKSRRITLPLPLY
jgi:hypothetical protein